MKHGISLLPDCRPAARSGADYYQDAIEISVLADRLGLDYVKMTEHYLGDYGGYCPSPLTFLAAVAARTTRIRLMTGAVLPAFHHPIQIAAHTAMVDAISGGRLDVGFGRAWLPYEFAAFGVPIDESRPRYEATIAAVVRLWTEQKVTEDTPYFSFQDATSLPAVTQQPHPPVWGAAVRSPESFEWLGRHGYGLLFSPPPVKHLAEWSREMIQRYRDAFRAAHGPDQRPRVALSVPLYVAETDEEAYRVAEPYYRESLAVLTDAMQSWQVTSSGQYVGYDLMAVEAQNLRELDVRAFGTAVIGGPDTVRAKIDELRAVIDPDVCLWGVDFGGQPGDAMRASLCRFAEQVLPRL